MLTCLGPSAVLSPVLSTNKGGGGPPPHQVPEVPFGLIVPGSVPQGSILTGQPGGDDIKTSGTGQVCSYGAGKGSSKIPT